MHPTIDEQLERIARLIERCAERHPGDPSIDRLRTAAGTLRRIAASWEAMPGFLRWDNRATQTLLEGLARHLPEAAAASTRALAAAEIDPTAVRAAHDHNKALRASLAKAVQALPADAPEARAVIAAHLRERIARDPSSGRARR